MRILTAHTLQQLFGDNDHACGHSKYRSSVLHPVHGDWILHPAYRILLISRGKCVAAAYLPTTNIDTQTMGMRLEDIDLFFRESPSVWSTVKFAKTRQQRTETEILSDKNIVEHQEKV